MLTGILHPRSTNVVKEVQKAALAKDAAKAHDAVASYVKGNETKVLRRAAKLFDHAIATPNPVAREFFLEQALIPVLREKSARFTAASALTSPHDSEKLMAAGWICQLGHQTQQLPTGDRLARLEDQMERIVHEAGVEHRVALAYATTMSSELIAQLGAFEKTSAGNALFERLPRVMLQFDNIAADLSLKRIAPEPLQPGEVGKANKFIEMARKCGAGMSQAAGLTQQDSELLLGHMSRYFDEADLDGIIVFLDSELGREYRQALRHCNPEIGRARQEPWVQARVEDVIKNMKPTSPADANNFGSLYIEGLERCLTQGSVAAPAPAPAVEVPVSDVPPPAATAGAPLSAPVLAPPVVAPQAEAPAVVAQPAPLPTVADAPERPVLQRSAVPLRVSRTLRSPVGVAVTRTTVG